jgi:hypothetical protein
MPAAAVPLAAVARAQAAVPAVGHTSRYITFVAHPGSTAGSMSLESYNFPGRYIRHRNFELWVDLYADNDTFRADSSFTITSTWTAA